MNGALLVQFKHRILGFTEENIIKYVTSVFKREGKKAVSTIDQCVGGANEVIEAAKIIDDVVSYIDKYPQIKACLYIPLNAAVVVSIYREGMQTKRVLPSGGSRGKDGPWGPWTPLFTQAECISRIHPY